VDFLVSALFDAATQESTDFASRDTWIGLRSRTHRESFVSLLHNLVWAIPCLCDESQNHDHWEGV